MNPKLLLLIFIVSTQSAFCINPMREYKIKPDQFKIGYQELKVITKDGYELNTWIMESTAAIKKEHTFIIAGSDAGNMGFTLSYAVYLLKAGYDVVTFDYRGFGASSDFDFNPNNMYHTAYITDFVTIVNWVKKEKQAKKIGILAFSMGSLIATSGFEKSSYDFLACEGFIYSPKQNQSRIKQQKDKKLILPDDAKNYNRRLKELDIPILLFAGSLDQITTLKDSKRVARKKPQAKVIEFDGAHLKGALTMGIDKYINEITVMAN
ncbi:MAG: alpha/beta fold hydrolase [Bacteroidota bacterium]